MLYHLSEKERLILRLLHEHPELGGVELVKHSKGQLGRGTVYVTLERMEDKGLVRRRVSVPTPPATMGRHYFKATALGQRTYAAVEASLELLRVRKRKA